MQLKEKIRDRIWYILFLLSLVILTVVIIVLIVSMHKTDNKKTDVLGAVFIGSVDDGGWNQCHYEGLVWVCKKYNLDLLTEENVGEDEEECRKAVESLVSKGATAIFLTSDGFGSRIYPVVEDYPDVMFYTVSPEAEQDNMFSYFGRIYQMRYLSGIIAGTFTDTDKLGLVAAMSNPQVDRGINAYYLGAKSVNEDIKLYVRVTGSWSSIDAEADAAQSLIEEGCDILAYHTSTATTMDVAEDNGVSYFGFNILNNNYGEHCLANLVFNWDVIYDSLIQDLLRGSAVTKGRYWGGISEDAVDIEYVSPEIDVELNDRLNDVKSSFTKGFDVFLGEIKSNDGVVRCRSNERIGDETLLFDMDWMVEGVQVDVE